MLRITQDRKKKQFNWRFFKASLKLNGFMMFLFQNKKWIMRDRLNKKKRKNENNSCGTRKFPKKGNRNYVQLANY